MRTGLLLLQAALSVLLLVGAGLFVQSLRNVRALRLGYDVEPVLYARQPLHRQAAAFGFVLPLRLLTAPS